MQHPTQEDPTLAEPFTVRIAVRAYELDPQGHLNQAVYTQYAEHARWECLRAAGVTPEVLVASGAGPALLKVTMRYQRELGAGDEVDVGCVFAWGNRRLVDVVQDFRLPDGTRVATLEGTFGLLDLATRRLVADPRGRLRTLATAPHVLRLDDT